VSPQILGLIIWTFGSLLSLFINVFFFSIIIWVILSWLAPTRHHAISETLYLLTDPILGPARRLMRPIGGFDLSPIVAIIILKLVEILLISPITNYGIHLAVN